MVNKKFVIRFTVGDVCKGLICSPVLVVLIATVVCLPWESTSAPAWVQAVGSVLAIVVAIWVAQHQSTTQRKLELAKNIEFVKKISIMLERVFVDASRAGDAIEDPTKLIHKSIYEGLSYGNRVVQSIDPLSVPTAELMSKWLAIRDVLQALEKDFEFFINSNPKNQGELLEREMKKHALGVNRDKFVKWQHEFKFLVSKFSS